MVKIIVLFNHKGGVSKTTTTLNLGWMLAEKGKKVLLADFDPQCNLTGIILDYQNSDDLNTLYEAHKNLNIKEGLSPAFDSQPTPISPTKCVVVPGVAGLFLLPGHIGLAEYEVTLGIAQELSGSIMTLRNLPGSIHALLCKTAEQLGVDYILVDTSPSLSAFNRNLLIFCYWYCYSFNIHRSMNLIFAFKIKYRILIITRHIRYEILRGLRFSETLLNNPIK